MITQFFLDLIYKMVALLLTPFQIIFQPLGSMAGLIELLSYASMFIPLGVFAGCITVWLGYYTLRLVMVLINWGIAKIPTIE